MSGNELTLLLNADYTPIKAIRWETAVKLFYSDKVAIVAEYKRFIRCASHQMRVPAVVALTKYYSIYNFYKVRFTNSSLYARDGYRCSYCGEKFTKADLTKDHVIPRAHFRKGQVKESVRETCWANIVTACRPCNAKKGPRTPDEAGMELLRRPFEPTFVNLTTNVDNIPDEWRPYTNM